MSADAPVLPVPGRASGIGSWPGGDVLDGARTVFGELPEPHLPHLPELPARGPGSELIGRGAAFLVELPVDLQPSGWRLVDRPGRDLNRATSFLRTDLEVLAEVADGYSGPLKVQVCGPWTLAASIQLPRLERAVVDRGACRDLVASLAEGVRRHVEQVRRLVPAADVVLQLDEPSLPAVLAGGLPTSSGFGRIRAVAEPVVVEGLSIVLDAAAEAGAVGRTVHCCAADVPVDALVRTGATGVSLDADAIGRAGWEALAAPIENGLELWAGVVPTRGEIRATGPTVDAVWRRWRALGLDAGLLASVVLTPACGLAGSPSPADARARLSRVREAAAGLAERAAEAR
ncbi:MAG: hypothetical protein JNL54_17650 [Kineosporiaceae bacterium]|nr:hypothetical protein [Kineosporiaceae bacterium]